MYSKEEAYLIKKKFWTSFGKYMILQKSEIGVKVNWLNYKTGVKDIYFKMNVDNKSAIVLIEISQKNIDMQSLFYEKFESLQTLLDNFMLDWTWNKQIINEQGNIVSTIETKIENVSIFRESDWVTIFDFLKNNIKNLDKFWTEYGELFKNI